jgi:thiamine kinase-like enzyme
MVSPLNTLACFHNIKTIEPIKKGLSSQCYRVKADNKVFFAKQIHSIDESLVCIQAAINEIAPKVIYHDEHWLITDFIEGENLSSCQYAIEEEEEKIIIATTLMSRCHQLNVQTVRLIPEKIIKNLIDGQFFSTQQHQMLLHFSQSIIESINLKTKASSKLVCCHGDINYSNILTSLKKEIYLIDYECACLAPAEYDLAMFISVNNIAKNKISTIIKHYKKHTLHDIDLKSLNSYLQFCYFINALWYIHSYKESNTLKLSSLAKEQWENLTLSHNAYLTDYEFIAKAHKF